MSSRITEEQKKEENVKRLGDRARMNDILNGTSNEPFEAESYGAYKFLVNEVYHDQAKNGRLEAEYIRRFKDEHWFQKTFNDATKPLP